MKLCGSLLILVSASIAGMGCVAGNSYRVSKPQSNMAEQSDVKNRILFLKASIKAVALKYQAQSNVLEGIDQARAEMIPLIAELVALVPAKKPSEMVPQLYGVWQALWRDEDITLRRDVSGTLNSGVRVLPDQAYQGFFAKDLAYVNFANSEITRKDPATGIESKVVAAGFLFATFTPTENFNKALFRVVYSRKKPLAASEDLAGLTAAIWDAHKLTQSAVDEDKNKGLSELEALGVAKNTRVGEYPKGPINSPGEQRNIYLDDDFRVSLGSNGDETPQFDLVKDDKKYGLNVTVRVSNSVP